MRNLVLLLGLALVGANLLTGQQGRSLLAAIGQVKAGPPTAQQIVPPNNVAALPPASPAPVRPGVVGGNSSQGVGQFQQ